MDATVLIELDQLPPGVGSLSTTDPPIHIDVGPVMAAGGAATVIDVVTKQPPTPYEMTGVPTATPVTTPVPITTVASPKLLLLHVPPVVALESVMELVVQTKESPVIAGGTAVIVTLAEAPVIDVTAPQGAGEAPVQERTHLSPLVPVKVPAVV